ncbi:MAG TPA: glycerophosphodiester phosphodiesterase [Acidimicrobiales bacterium]|nr:glycerophosphodiester phosphodiesterase [Acidimicrobiales bacterium]
MAAGNPWLERTDFHWAHQGGAREGPSNTVYAMRRALAAGADGLELDVHASADGHVVVAHDATLERTTNGRGRIAEHTLAQLRALDAAYWWVPGLVDDHDPATPVERYVLRGQVAHDPDLGVPALDDVLAAFPVVPLTVEVKDTRAEEALVATLRRHGRTSDVIVTSFRDSVVHRLRRLAPELGFAPGRFWNVAFLARAALGLAPRRAWPVALQLPPRYGGLTVITRRLVVAARRAGMAVHAWTIDEEDEMRALLTLGVDAIMTDRPSVLARVLGEAAAP